jgi:probable HAF family extracellular repeat protein
MALPQRVRRCFWLSLAAVVVVALATTMTSASAAGSGPVSQIPGFLLDRGRYSTIAHPSSRVPLGPIGINERGQIVGSYTDRDGTARGFLLDRQGRFASIDVPGSTGTQAEKINNRGQVVGVYVDVPNPTQDAPRRGFLLDRGRFTRLDGPGAVSTLAHGINDRGQVVGEFKDAGGTIRGFVWDKGRFTTFDGPDGTGASFNEINDRGQIVGVYGESGGRPSAAFFLAEAFMRRSPHRAPWAPSPSASTTAARSRVPRSTMLPERRAEASSWHRGYGGPSRPSPSRVPG